MSNTKEETIHEETSETQDTAVTAAEDAAGAAADAVAAAAEEATETVADTVEEATEVAAEAAGDAEEAVEAAAEEASEVVEEATEAAAEAVEDAADAAETAAGDAVAAAAEATEEVAEAAADAVEAATEEVVEAAAEATEEVAEAATEAVEASAEEVAEAAEEVAEAVEAATEEAAEAAGEAAEEVAEATAEAVAATTEEVAETAAEATEQAAGEAPAAAETSQAADSEVQPDATMLMLEKALADKAMVKGQVIGWNKGGYHVAIDKIAAFCPVSQIEIGNPRSPKRYLDKSFDFRVLEIQKGGRRVVLSRAEALKAEREARAKLVRERLKQGETLEGKVTSITTFGAFVDLGGGIEGLVHISELSRRRVEHPKELVQVGQEVKVMVLKIEKNGQRISLSMKRLEDDPWAAVADRFPPGDKFTGKILRKTDFGMFVEMESGLEGLVHLSRLPLGVTIEDESLAEGNEIEVWVHDVDSKRRRLSLSMREVTGGNPWKGVSDRFPEGEIVTGTVERLTKFGVFIELEPGLTGLLPFSAIPGIANPKRQFHPGKEVQVRVLSIDTGRKRISLGTEASKAEGSPQDYREYQKTQAKSSTGGLNALAAAFAKLKQEDQGKQP